MGNFALFNDIKRVVRGSRLEDESIKTVFGDVKLDLTQAPLAAGDHDLHLLTLFGDIKIRIPEHVGLSINARMLFSDFEVETRSSGVDEKPGNSWQSEHFDQASVRVHLSLEGLFGDIEVVRVPVEGVPSPSSDTSGYEGATQRLPQE